MLQQTLSDLLHLHGENKRGNCALLYVPKEGVLSMPDLKSLMRTGTAPSDCDFYAEEIVLRSGYSWLDLSADCNYNIELTGDDKDTAQGKDHPYVLSFNLPNDSFTYRGKPFRAYDNREGIILVKQRTGAWRVLGSLKRGCFFNAKFGTGSQGKGANQHECTFTWEVGAQRAFYINPFPLDDYFEVTGTIDGTHHVVSLFTNETVYVVWGDGNSEIVQGMFAPSNAVSHTYAESEFIYPYTYRVYHRNLATKANAPGILTVNETVSAVTGTLPPVTEVLFQDNEMNAAAIEAALIAIDAVGTVNGTADFRDQTPAVVPTAGMIAARALLLLKGWTVNY